MHSKQSIQSKSHRFIPENSTTPIFGSFESQEILPKTAFSKDPVDPRIAYRMVADEMMHDGNPRYNLATFVQTYMEPEAIQVMVDTLSTNSIDKSEYPQTTEIEKRCVHMISDLWNVDQSENFMGTSTLGSSEACMMAALSMKFRWREKAHSLGIDTLHKKANLVISSGYQVVWEKFCVYWDIEMRVVPMNDIENLCLDTSVAVSLCDEYTIGVIAIMGITYTGLFDDVMSLDALLHKYNQKAQIPVSIHVDAASGGFYLPFVNPDLLWDFRLKNVISISSSGHKFGLVYPGIGWIIWRDESYLPKVLRFDVEYLGSSFEPTFQINFSRPGSQIWAQYYNFVRFGFEGYKAIHQKSKEVALSFSRSLSETGIFDIINNGDNIPIVCWKLKKNKVIWNEYDLSDRLRYYGWQIPSYPLPHNLKDIVVMRSVIRSDFSMEQLSLLIEDLYRSIENLNTMNISDDKDNNRKKPSGFNH